MPARAPRLAAVATACLCALVVLAGHGSLAAQEPVIYRCTDQQGAVTIQNDVPCPAGSTQQVRKVEVPAPPPGFVPPLPAPPPVAAPPPAADFVRVAGPANERIPRPQLPAPLPLEAGERLPPPPIYQCHTWDNDSYISEDPAPKPRCVPLDTGGVGAACETRYDQCARVPDNAACKGWQRRQREIESSWLHARAADKAALQDEFARVTRILQDSTCQLR